MAYWEFLLQKEGDRDWLPLETAHVEISEGRYRIVAHTSYCETSVEIRLSQLLTDQTPPKRRTLRRLGRTTASGLMVVIPYTHLTAGSWMVKCAAVQPEINAAATEPWEYGVQLQVLAIESDLDYWDSDLDESVSRYSVPPENLPNSKTQTPFPSAFSTPDVLPAESATPSTSSTSTTVSSAQPAPALLDSASLGDLPLRLQLRHQAMVAQPQTPLTLQGQVTTFSQVEGLPAESTLWVQLRDPETGQVLYRKARSLSISALPSRFDFPILLPENVTARLLVGEMSLWSATTPPQVFAIQGFTVTLNLDALLESVANQGEQSSQPLSEDVAPATSIKTPIPRVREIPFRRIYLPSTGLTLPPVIYRPIDRKTGGSPSLPTFSGQSSSRRATGVAPSPVAKPRLPLADTSESEAVPKETDTNPGASSSAVELPIFRRSRRPAPEVPPEIPNDFNEPLSPLDESPNQTTEPIPGQESPAGKELSDQETREISFRPDFQGRFWSRLSALAHASQEAAANLKAQMEAAGITPQYDTSSPEAHNLPSPPLYKEANAFGHEVVIYDSDPEEIIVPDASIDDTEADFAELLATEKPQASDRSEAQTGAVPVPQLSLPKGELVAGTPLPITVDLPLYPKRLAVKVWVTDIQSRSLVDRPRWLMNWTPTATGEQTAILQLQVPSGSVEAQFEAIAIDLTTQRESYKTTLVRTIVPPDLPETDLPDSV